MVPATEMAVLGTVATTEHPAVQQHVIATHKAFHDAIKVV